MEVVSSAQGLGRFATLFSCMLICLSLSGCIVGAKRPEFDQRLLVGREVTTSATPYLVQAQTCQNPPDASQPPATANTPSGLKALRNACIDQTMAAIKASYIEYRRTIARNVGVTEEAFDIGSSAASGAGAPLTAAGKKVAGSVLSGLGGFLGSAKTTADADTLYKQTLSTLFKQMDADLDGVGAEIIQAETLEYESYPMSHARFDLLRYYQAGLLLNALDTLDSTAGAAKQACSAAQADSATAKKQGANIQKAVSVVAGAAGGPTPPAATTAPAAPAAQEKCAQLDQVAKTAIANYSHGPNAQRLTALLFPKENATPRDYTPDPTVYVAINACMKTSNFANPNTGGALGFVDSQAETGANGLSAEDQKAQVLGCLMTAHPEMFPAAPK